MNNLPSTVGGGGFHADGKLPRFREVDFRARTELGPIDGADVVDWPLDYDELEPYYAEAERVVGVAGDHTANPFAAWRSGPVSRCRRAPTCSAPCSRARPPTRLGYHPYRAPTGVNSVEYDGRPACNNCGFCGFFGCPIDAKGDPVALAAARAAHRPVRDPPRVLRDRRRARRAGRQARGVRYLDTRSASTRCAPATWCSRGGAFETPRLLLRSGIGNPDVVGRYLMFHFQTLVLGIFPFRLHAHRGRAVTHLMDDPIDPGRGGARAAAGSRAPLLPRRDRRARRRRPADHGGDPPSAR